MPDPEKQEVKTPIEAPPPAERLSVDVSPALVPFLTDEARQILQQQIRQTTGSDAAQLLAGVADGRSLLPVAEGGQPAPPVLDGAPVLPPVKDGKIGTDGAALKGELLALDPARAAIFNEIIRAGKLDKEALTKLLDANLPERTLRAYKDRIAAGTMDSGMVKDLLSMDLPGRRLFNDLIASGRFEGDTLRQLVDLDKRLKSTNGGEHRELRQTLDVYNRSNPSAEARPAFERLIAQSQLPSKELETLLKIDADLSGDPAKKAEHRQFAENMRRFADMAAQGEPLMSDSRSWARANVPDGERYQHLMHEGIRRALQTSGLAEQGWVAIQSRSQSPADRASVDIVLFNTKTGKWVPLDVSLMDKGNKPFYIQSQRHWFDERTGEIRQTRRPSEQRSPLESLQERLTQYLTNEHHQRHHMDISSVPPPQLGEARPERREGVTPPANEIEARQRAIEDYRQSLEQRLREPGVGAAERDAINQMLRSFIGPAIDHASRETEFRSEAVSAAQRALERLSKDPASAGKVKLDDLTRQLLRVEDGQLEANNGKTGRDRRTYDGGQIDRIIDEAIRKIENDTLRQQYEQLVHTHGREAVAALMLDELSRSWKDVAGVRRQAAEQAHADTYRERARIGPEVSDRLIREYFGDGVTRATGRDGRLDRAQLEQHAREFLRDRLLTDPALRTAVDRLTVTEAGPGERPGLVYRVDGQRFEPSHYVPGADGRPGHFKGYMIGSDGKRDPRIVEIPLDEKVRIEVRVSRGADAMTALKEVLPELARVERDLTRHSRVKIPGVETEVGRIGGRALQINEVAGFDGEYVAQVRERVQSVADGKAAVPGATPSGLDVRTLPMLAEAAQALNTDELRTADRDTVRHALDAVEKRPGWSDADWRRFEDLRRRYGAGDAQAVQQVNELLGRAADRRPGAEGGLTLIPEDFQRLTRAEGPSRAGGIGDIGTMRAGEVVRRGGQWYQVGDREAVRIAGREVVIGDRPITIGRSDGRGDRPDIDFTRRNISGEQAVVGHDEGGVYLINKSRREGDPGLGTWVRRGDRWESLKPDQKIYLKDVDEVRLGGRGDRSARLEVGLELRPIADTLRWREDHVPSRESIDLSNRYRLEGRIRDRLPNGFQNAGDQNIFDQNGRFSDNLTRPSTVVDLERDPVLRATIEDARRRFAHLRDNPRALAEALARYSKELLTPPGGDAALDAWYERFNADHAGERVLLGDFIRQGRGVCSQQALLLKVLGDAMGLEVSLVRGYSGPFPSQAQLEAMTAQERQRWLERRANHAWTEVRVGRETLVFDPRQEVHGRRYSELPWHKPASEMPLYRERMRAAGIAPEGGQPGGQPAIPEEFRIAEQRRPGAPQVVGVEIDPETGRLRERRVGGQGEVIRDVREITPELLAELYKERIKELERELREGQHDQRTKEAMEREVAALREVERALSRGDRQVFNEVMRALTERDRRGPIAEVGGSRMNKVRTGAGIVFSLAMLYAAARGYMALREQQQQSQQPSGRRR